MAKGKVEYGTDEYGNKTKTITRFDKKTNQTVIRIIKYDATTGLVISRVCTRYNSEQQPISRSSIYFDSISGRRKESEFIRYDPESKKYLLQSKVKYNSEGKKESRIVKKNGGSEISISYDENERVKSEEIINKDGTFRKFNYRYGENGFIVRKIRRDFDSEGNKVGMKFWTFDPETRKLERKTTLEIDPSTGYETKIKEKNYIDGKLQSKHITEDDESKKIDSEYHKYINVNLEKPKVVYESKTSYNGQTIEKEVIKENSYNGDAKRLTICNQDKKETYLVKNPNNNSSPVVIKTSIYKDSEKAQTTLSLSSSIDDINKHFDLLYNNGIKM